MSGRPTPRTGAHLDLEAFSFFYLFLLFLRFISGREFLTETDGALPRHRLPTNHKHHPWDAPCGASAGVHSRNSSRHRPTEERNIHFRFQRFGVRCARSEAARQVESDGALPGHRLPTHHQHTIHRTPHAMPHSTLRKCISFRTPSNERNSFRFQIPPDCYACAGCVRFCFLAKKLKDGAEGRALAFREGMAYAMSTFKEMHQLSSAIVCS